jgi:hypothetical protein
LLGLSLGVVIAVGLGSCGGVSLPDELRGDWSDNSIGCEVTFHFGASSFDFTTACPYTGTSSSHNDVVEVFEAESLLRTDDDMYFGWHIEGSTLHLIKTNSYSPHPTWPSDWWTDTADCALGGGAGCYTLARQ